MVIVTGIKTAIKIAPIIYKVAQVGFKGLKKTRAFDRYMARHPKVLRAGTLAATGGTLVYELINIDYDSLIGQIPKTYRKFKQTRGNVYPSRARQLYKTDYCPVPRRRYGKQRRFQRSRYR